MAKMHGGEIDIDLPLVARLLAAQFPRWAELPLQPVEPAGTDNAIFRLGDTMAVRLPRIHWAIDQPAKERAWLPVLAPHLALAIPTPLALGEPADGYPWHWSVCTWLPGDLATPDSTGGRGLAFYLQPRGGKFAGAVTTRPPAETGLDGRVSYWVELRKQP
jgi:aminoglycoside phosphotransferase (APT) family kinase protein